MQSRPRSKDSKSKKRQPSLITTPRDPTLAKVVKKTARCADIQHKMSSIIYPKDKGGKLQSVQSRKLTARRNSVDKPKSVLKTHNKSNSVSAKPELLRNTFRIDLSSVIPRQDVHPQVGNELNRSHFTFHYLIGRGGFSKVWSVQLKKTRKKYAIKEMLKTKIIQKNSVNSVLSELKLLTQLRHPFMVNIFCAFHEREYLCLAIDFLSGGDLRYHLSRKRRFKESEVKFFLACVITALEYLHHNKVIHRDLKPENLILDKKGYLKVTDFGIARRVKVDNRSDTSGTPGYMAPEVMLKQDHSFGVDYYALGVIAYEFMTGMRPYNGQNRKQILESILAKQVQVSLAQLPKGWSHHSVDFVNRLIQRKCCDRLGQGGIRQIKEHPWFKGFPWDKLTKKQIQSTYIPKSIAENVDYRAQISSCSDQEIDHAGRLMLRFKEQEANIDLFEDYCYNPAENTPTIQVNRKSRDRSRNNSKKHSTGTTTGTFNSNHEELVNKKPSKKTLFFN